MDDLHIPDLDGLPHATMPARPEGARLGLLYGRFENVGPLGEGGMGSVRRVREAATGQSFALKRIRPDQAADPGTVHRFRREFRALARLDHPGVIRVHTWLEGEDGAGYLMDLIEGDTFFHAFRARFQSGVDFGNHDRSFAAALDWFIQAYEALSYIHRQGFVHRDIKPANFLVDEKGRVVLADFGLVRPADPLADSGALTQKGTVLGTCNYMAPEQARGLAVDHRADLYALTVMAYELFAGRHPFADRQGTAMMVAHAGEQPVAPRALRPDMPAELDGFLMAGMQKEPFRRPPFGHVAARALRALAQRMAEPQVVAPPRPARDPTGPAQPTTPLPVQAGASTGGRGAFLMGSPFIGRDLELAQAGGWLSGMVSGERRLPGFLAALIGESGIGKTRFLREVLALARLKGMAVIEEVSPEHSRPVLDTVSRVAARLLRPGDDLLNNAEIRALGAWLPGLPLSDEETGDLAALATPEMVRARGERVFLDLLQRSAARKPLVIALDDAQWMDAESARVWGRVWRERIAPREEAAGDRGDPIALLVSLRAEDENAEHLAALRKRVAAGEAPAVRLGPFSAEETERFVQQMLGQDQPPQRLGARIHEETEGHPFFIEETLKALVETGRLVFEAGAAEPWRLLGDEQTPVTSFASTALPRSIQQALLRRLEGFSDLELKLLRFAACLGRRFHFDALIAAASVDEDLALDAAELFIQRQLWREADAKGNWYLFQHDMIREILRDEQGPRRVRRMHGRILEVLRGEPRWCASGDPREELASHAIAAELDEEALPLLLAAGDARMQEAAVEQALNLSRQALSCMDRLTEIGRGEPLRRRMHLLHRMVLCATLMGRPSLATPWIEAYLDLEQRARRAARSVPLLRTAYPRLPCLDPAASSNTADSELCSLVHRGLVERHPLGVVTPAVAASWSCSEDGRRWTFRIAKDAVFHDGTPVTSADVVASWRRVLAPGGPEHNAWILLPIEGAAAFHTGDAPHISGLETPDARTLHVTVTEPLAFFLDLLSMDSAAVLPAATPRVEMEHPVVSVGCGPYRLASLSRDRVELRATGAPFGVRPATETIHIAVDGRAMDPAAQAALVADGQLDYASYLEGSHRVREQLGGTGLRVEQSPLLHVYMLGIRCDLAPMDQPLVRRALAYALDRQYIVDRARGGEGVPSVGLLPPGVLGHDPNARGIPYDPDRARRLLREAGFPDGVDLHVVRGTPPPGRVQSLEVAIEMAAASGFRITLETLDDQAMERRPEWRRRSHLFSAGWIGDYPDPDGLFYPLFHGVGGDSFGFAYRNPALDALITEGRRTMDREQRMLIYRRAERILAEDVPCVFLWHQKACIAWNPAVLSPPPFSVVPPFFHPEHAQPPDAE